MTSYGFVFNVAGWTAIFPHFMRRCGLEGTNWIEYLKLNLQI